MAFERPIALAALLGLAAAAAPAGAQDNPIPLNYRNLTVTAVEVNNNQRRDIRDARVTVTLESGGSDPFASFPQTRTTGARGALFGKLPPSGKVGPYLVSVSTRDCGEQSKTHRMGGGSDQRLLFTFSNCGQSAENSREFERRKQGGNDLTVKVLRSTGIGAGGYSVQLKSGSGEVVKTVRTGGAGDARFRAIAAGTYTIDVKQGARTVASVGHDMPDQASSTTIRLP